MENFPFSRQRQKSTPTYTVQVGTASFVSHDLAAGASGSIKEEYFKIDRVHYQSCLHFMKSS